MAGKKAAEAPMKIQIPIYMPAELKAIVEAEAARHGMTQTAYMVWAIAEKAGRPDLAYVPQKRSNRPPSVLATPSPEPVPA